MRVILVGMGVFWTVHFALSGLGRARPADPNSADPLAVALPFDVGPSLQHLVGFAEFGVAALFALALMLAIFGKEDERSDMASMMAGAVTAGLLLLALQHGIAWWAGAPQVVTFLAAGLLLMTGAVSMFAEGRRQAAPEQVDEEALRVDFMQARLAEATADIRHLPAARPTS